MTSTLTQKHPLKGSREFKIIEDEIHYTINSPFKNDSLSVLFDVLDPNPLITSSMLSFKSKVNNEPLVELFLNKPNKEAFDQFVETIRQKIIENDFGRFRVKDEGVDVNVERLDEAIDMLQKNVDPNEIKVFLSAMIALKANPTDVTCQNNVAEAFNELGFAQSQVIIYAPYINFMFSGDR